jgi:hypothetical protein
MTRRPHLRIVRLLQLFLIAYLIVVLVALIFQRRLVYFPTRIPANVVESVAREHGFTPWKTPDGRIIGWEMAASGPVTGSVLIVHGNGGCALSRDYLAQPIHFAADVDVYVLEYPGYGAREGSPSRKSFLAAAEEGFQQMPAGAPKYLVSESIGAGVACELARNHPSEVAGLAMFGPYDNLASVAQHRMWFLPAYFLLLDRFNPGAALPSYHGPVQFVIAGDDEILGPDTGRKLFAAYAGPKNLDLIPGAHHNDVAEQSVEWWHRVFAFWEQNKT